MFLQEVIHTSRMILVGLSTVGYVVLDAAQVTSLPSNSVRQMGSKSTRRGSTASQGVVERVPKAITLHKMGTGRSDFSTNN